MQGIYILYTKLGPLAPKLGLLTPKLTLGNPFPTGPYIIKLLIRKEAHEVVDYNRNVLS